MEPQRTRERVFAGRAIDATLLRDLPPEIDPCGENGEFHSFVYDGPIFRRPVRITVGEVVSRDSRYFADFVPVDSLSPANTPGA